MGQRNNFTDTILRVMQISLLSILGSILGERKLPIIFGTDMDSGGTRSKGIIEGDKQWYIKYYK